QPPEPLELWKSPPFEPRIEGKFLYGRGASDNKGQHLAHLKAVEAYVKTGTELPCDLTFLIEGEEEVGSSNLADFLKENRKTLTALEHKELAKIPFNESSYKKFIGVPELFGEKGFTAIERRSARPTFEINGLTSGYQGEGSKTIVPAWARAKITCRLVPNQNPAKIIKLVHRHLKKLCPPSVRLEIKSGHGAEPYLVSPTSAQAQ